MLQNEVDQTRHTADPLSFPKIAIFGDGRNANQLVQKRSPRSGRPSSECSANYGRKDTFTMSQQVTRQKRVNPAPKQSDVSTDSLASTRTIDKNLKFEDRDSDDVRGV